MIEIRTAQFPAHLDTVRAIFREYADSLNIDMGFQDFNQELAELPGKYAPPRGTVLLAWQDGEVIGCAAMRPIDQHIGEMKRLYVRPAGRRLALGKRLAVSIIDAAKEAGYRQMRLDTLPSMTAAQALYASLGFADIPAYVFNPIPGTRYLELDLATWPQASVAARTRDPRRPGTNEEIAVSRVDRQKRE